MDIPIEFRGSQIIGDWDEQTAVGLVLEELFRQSFLDRTICAWGLHDILYRDEDLVKAIEDSTEFEAQYQRCDGHLDDKTLYDVICEDTMSNTAENYFVSTSTEPVTLGAALKDQTPVAEFLRKNKVKKLELNKKNNMPLIRDQADEGSLGHVIIYVEHEANKLFQNYLREV